MRKCLSYAFVFFAANLIKMKKIFILFGSLFLSLCGISQTTKDLILKNFCGCFEVSFKYAETFSPDSSYKFHDREIIPGTPELALPIEVSENKIVIQHLLVVSPKFIVKHWREEWTFENNELWKYTKENTWEKQTLSPEEVKGMWTQTVWEVSDAIRYQGYSPFINLDGQTLWQNTADAPLPRREYSIRNDYNILKRTNRLVLTDSGYVHEQDNKKIIRGNSGDKLLAEEKGYNIYKKLDMGKCVAALEYWENNKNFWEQVRNNWSTYLSKHNFVNLKFSVEGKMLHERLETLRNDYNSHKISSSELNLKLKKELALYTGESNSTAVK